MAHNALTKNEFASCVHFLLLIIATMSDNENEFVEEIGDNEQAIWSTSLSKSVTFHGLVSAYAKDDDFIEYVVIWSDEFPHNSPRLYGRTKKNIGSTNKYLEYLSNCVLIERSSNHGGMSYMFHQSRDDPIPEDTADYSFHVIKEVNAFDFDKIN